MENELPNEDLIRQLCSQHDKEYDVLTSDEINSHIESASYGKGIYSLINFFCICSHAFVTKFIITMLSVVLFFHLSSDVIYGMRVVCLSIFNFS